MHQDKYARWFVQQPNNHNLQDSITHGSESLSKESLFLSSWLDASAAEVKIRALAIPEVLEYIEEAPQEDFGDSKQNKDDIYQLFKTIQTKTEDYQSGQNGPMNLSISRALTTYG